MPDGDGVRLTCAPAWEADIYANSPIGAARLAKNLTCPVTLLYGDSDSTVPESEVEILSREANARVVKVPGTSHFLPMEKPEVVREEIARMADALKSASG
jgi:pimeloyl-ACP methyl ester carboxylesterase